MRWLNGMTADGKLREKHEQMKINGERPPFLEEYYSSARSLHREAHRLADLGYRIRTRQDMRDAHGYRVLFVYVGAHRAGGLA